MLARCLSGLKGPVVGSVKYHKARHLIGQPVESHVIMLTVASYELSAFIASSQKLVRVSESASNYKLHEPERQWHQLKAYPS